MLNTTSDFRMIPLGDIDLHREIRLEGHFGVVGPRHERPRVRRVYSAKIDGRKPKATVAVYQGEGAEEVRRIVLVQNVNNNSL